MIKIIKNGIDPSRKMYVTTCDECGCEFMFSKSDTEKSCIEDDIYCFAYTVKCPCCGETLYMGSLKKTCGKEVE